MAQSSLLLLCVFTVTWGLSFALVPTNKIPNQSPSPKAEVGFQQELYLYEGDAADATFHVFRNSIENLTEWPFYNKKTVTKVCSRGAWIFYKDPKFRGYVFGNYSHNINDNCHVKASGTRFPFEESQSIRFVGAKHTSQEQVSFFTEEFFQGTEYSTDPVTKSMSGIKDEINSVVFTGYSNWTFFEDVNFNGSDRCFENSISRSLGQGSAISLRPKDIDYYARDPLIQSRLLGIGSVSNNCACKTEEMGIPGARDIADDDVVVLLEDEEIDNVDNVVNIPDKKPIMNNVRESAFT